MRIIENPSQKQLDELQEVLAKDQDAGIIDIGGYMVSLYLAAEDAGSVIGVASICLVEGGAELYKLYVAPSHRGKGVGKALLKRSLELLTARNIKELLIEIAGNSHDFWNQVASKYTVQWYDYEKFGILIDG
jgi:GNAT superfamily N-acetyltransferase